MNMKNLYKILLAGTMALIAIPMFALAAEFKAGDQVSLSSETRIEGDLYMAGGNTTSAGDVRGDLFVVGGSVLISGPVAGDVATGGGNVTILGDIADDLRAGGGTIVVQGRVRGDVLIGGGQINLLGKLISGDAVVAGGMVRVDSIIGGDLKFIGGEIYLNSSVAKNVNIKADKVTLGPKADIGGDFTYEAKELAVMEKGAVVRGETNFKEKNVKDTTEGQFQARLVALFTFWFIAKFLMFLIAGLLLGLIFRRYSRELVEKATANPLREFGRGVIAFIVLPVLSLILLATVVGIPLGILGIISFLALTIFAVITTPIFLGSVIYKWGSKNTHHEINWKTILFGIVVYFMLGFIPILGWIAIFISMMITIGSALSIKWTIVKEWR